jgi:hypothetical protein
MPCLKDDPCWAGKEIKNFIFMPKYDSSKRKMESARERELR